MGTFVNTFEPESSRNLFNMKFVIVFLLCSLLSSSLAHNSERPLNEVKCLDDKFNAIFKDCQKENAQTWSIPECKGKSGEDLETCTKDLLTKIGAVPNCIFKQLGVVDAAGKLDVENMKAIVVKHSTLTSGQITAAMAAFDVCLVSPPDSGSLTLNQPLTAYTCMAKSLESNGCA